MSAPTTHRTVKIMEAKEMVSDAVRAKLVPMLHGSPAIGKSSIVKQIAKDYGLKLIDIRLAQADPTDLLGFPQIDKTTGKATYAPMDTFPIEGDKIPEGYNGWLVFLDEFSSASKAVQAAAYKVVLDRQVGPFNLHSKVAIVCAGNLETDGAIVEEMSTAMQSRLIHLELVVDMQQWLDWAMTSGIDNRITSFIQFKPDALYSFSPDHTDRTYGSPRTWEFMDRLIKAAGGVVNKKKIPLYAGTVSNGLAVEFVTFTEIYTNLPTIERICANPSGLGMPDQPDILFALTGSIGNHMKDTNAEALMAYVKRMPIEFQIVTLREVVRRNKPALQYPAVQKWVATSSIDLF